MKEKSYLSSESLRKGQLKEVELAIEVDRICRKHNLQYWLDYGTLLGAVRHKGFIPWDDDMDLSMPTADFKKFLEIAPQEINPQFFVQTDKTDPQADMGGGLCKVRYNNTLFLGEDDVFAKQYHRGLSIDIFESKNTPLFRPYKLFHFVTHWKSKTYCFFKSRRLLDFKNILCFFTFPILHAFFSIWWKLICLTHRCNAEYINMNRRIYGKPTPKSEIYPLSTLEFEGYQFSVPNNYIRRVTDIFGPDYMTLPPVEKRRIHALLMIPEL